MSARLATTFPSLPVSSGTDGQHLDSRWAAAAAVAAVAAAVAQEVERLSGNRNAAGLIPRHPLAKCRARHLTHELAVALLYTVYINAIHLHLADTFIHSDLQRVHLLKETAIYHCGT